MIELGQTVYRNLLAALSGSEVYKVIINIVENHEVVGDTVQF